ncbi:MAG: substrate-binding domain-containing protein [Bifidobacterium breve]
MPGGQHRHAAAVPPAPLRLDVPKDISLTGFDDSTYAADAGLTTIHQDPTVMGSAAARKALSLLAGNTARARYRSGASGNEILHRRPARVGTGAPARTEDEAPQSLRAVRAIRSTYVPNSRVVSARRSSGTGCLPAF